jgi:predicted dinucleotide-binding enzyme
VNASSQHVKAFSKEIHTVDIAIIGTGNVGGALAGSFVRAGHNVTIAGRDDAKTRNVAASTGAHRAASTREAVASAQVIVLAVPFATSAEAVSREIADLAAGKVVVDVTNPVKPTFDGLVSDGGPSGAELIQGWLPGASVVKAFNTLLASRQADPIVDGEPVDAFVAADDRAAGEIVADLARSIGMRPMTVVPLRYARYLEGLAFLNIVLNATNGWTWQTSWHLVGVPEPVAA